MLSQYLNNTYDQNAEKLVLIFPQLRTVSI